MDIWWVVPWLGRGTPPVGTRQLHVLELHVIAGHIVPTSGPCNCAVFRYRSARPVVGYAGLTLRTLLTD